MSERASLVRGAGVYLAYESWDTPRAAVAACGRILEAVADMRGSLERRYLQDALKRPQTFSRLVREVVGLAEVGRDKKTRVTFSEVAAYLDRLAAASGAPAVKGLSVSGFDETDDIPREIRPAYPPGSWARNVTLDRASPEQDDFTLLGSPENNRFPEMPTRRGILFSGRRGPRAGGSAGGTRAGSGSREMLCTAHRRTNVLRLVPPLCNTVAIKGFERYRVQSWYNVRYKLIMEGEGWKTRKQVSEYREKYQKRWRDSRKSGIMAARQTRYLKRYGDMTEPFSESGSDMSKSSQAEKFAAGDATTQSKTWLGQDWSLTDPSSPGCFAASAQSSRKAHGYDNNTNSIDKLGNTLGLQRHTGGGGGGGGPPKRLFSDRDNLVSGAGVYLSFESWDSPAGAVVACGRVLEVVAGMRGYMVKRYLQDAMQRPQTFARLVREVVGLAEAGRDKKTRITFSEVEAYLDRTLPGSGAADVKPLPVSGFGETGDILRKVRQAQLLGPMAQNIRLDMVSPQQDDFTLLGSPENNRFPETPTRRGISFSGRRGPRAGGSPGGTRAGDGRRGSVCTAYRRTNVLGEVPPYSNTVAINGFERYTVQLWYNVRYKLTTEGEGWKTRKQALEYRERYQKRWRDSRKSGIMAARQTRYLKRYGDMTEPFLGSGSDMSRSSQVEKFAAGDVTTQSKIWAGQDLNLTDPLTPGYFAGSAPSSECGYGFDNNTYRKLKHDNISPTWISSEKFGVMEGWKKWIFLGR